jgi:hypothetical protein
MDTFSNSDENHIECPIEEPQCNINNDNKSTDIESMSGCHELVDDEYAKKINIIAKLSNICQISDYQNDGHVNIKDICDIDNHKSFDQLLEYVENNDVDVIQKKLDDINQIIASSDKSNTKNECKNLMMMKMFQRFKKIEHNCLEFREKSNQYNTYQKMYNTSKISAKEIHEYNVNRKLQLNDNQSNDDQSNDDRSNNDQSDMKQKLELLTKALTPYKMTQELLTYELLHFCNDPVVIFDEDNCEDISDRIKCDIDRFNPIVRAYLENSSWTINKKDTLNFSVPKNRIVLSNTIDTSDARNTILSTHMDMLVHYIKRCYKVSSLKYLIVEDNKYDITWVLIVIGFYCKKK